MRRKKKKGMDEQDLAVSNHVPYVLLEVLERAQLCLPSFDANCVMAEGIVCACKAARYGDDSTCHWSGRSGGVRGKRGEGQLGIVVQEHE